MCGIIGVLLKGASAGALDEALLWRMTDSLAHRGPDDRGIHIDRAAGVGLGHRRLSIIELSELGHQPMASDDGAMWIVFNGEIYNHDAIRRELEADGVRFRSRSDTEAILRLYERDGDRCVERLLGMSAFAIWDGRRRRLLVARDRLGVKPLYWSHAGGQFVFGSEVRALLEHPSVRRTLDEESLWHNLTFLSTPAPRTLFQDVSKLPAGHRIVVDASGARVERWWDALDAPPLPPELLPDEEAAAQELRARLETAVRDRMMSDVPFGAFLSGGVDSSANVALMAACSSQPINTLTVSFAGAGVGHLNELEHARRIAKQYGTRHSEIMIDHRSLLDYLPTLVEHMDDPVVDPVCVPLYYVSRLAHESGVKVVQIGEGSDELFVGYPIYLQAIRFSERLRFLRKAGRLPRRLVHGAAIPLLRQLGRHRPKRALEWAELTRRAMGEDVFLGGAIQLVDKDKRPLKPSGADHYSSWSIVERFYRDVDARWPDADTAQRMTYVELRQRLPELLLSRVYHITMTVGVEGREPFLDHRLVEFALRLPQSMKVQGCRTESILKKAVADLLPHDLLYRRKQGFPAPVALWAFEDEFGRVMRRTLEESPLIAAGLISGEVVRRFVDEHFGRRRDRGGILWTLFCLMLPYRRWLLGERSLPA